MQVKNELLFDAVAMTADRTSDAISVNQLVCGAIQCVWTGTPAGNIIVQASCDPVSPTNWIAIDTEAAGGAAGSNLVQLADIGYEWVRVFYDFSSSTGALTVRASFKGP